MYLFRFQFHSRYQGCHNLNTILIIFYGRSMFFSMVNDVRSFFSVKKIDLLDRSSYLKDLGNAESRLRQIYVFENFERDLPSRRLLAGVTSGFSKQKFEIERDSFCEEEELLRGGHSHLKNSYQEQKRQTFQEISQQLIDTQLQYLRPKTFLNSKPKTR